MPATDENLEFGIALESDRLVNSFVKGEDLLSEMTVVRNEFERGENNPASILNQRIYAGGLRMAQLRQVHHRQPVATSNACPSKTSRPFTRSIISRITSVLIVAGKFDEAKALALVEKYLGSIPKPTRKLDATYTEEPPQDGERTVTLRRVGAVGSVGVAYHVPAASHADWAPLSLLGGIISQSPNGRLYKALVESKLATNASARSDNSHDPGLFFASASCAPEKLDAVRDALVNDARIARRRAVHRRRGEQGEGPQQAERRDAPIEQPGDGAGAELGVEPRRLAVAVHPARSRRRRDGGRRQPRGENLFPEAQPHGRCLHPVQGIDATGGAQRSADRPGREGLQGRHASPRRAKPSIPRPPIWMPGSRSSTHGGLKAGLLHKKNRGETVSLVLTLHYGNAESLKGQTTAAGMLPGLMMAGTKKHDRQALREELDSLGIRIGTGGGGGGRGGRRRSPWRRGWRCRRGN